MLLLRVILYKGFFLHSFLKMAVVAEFEPSDLRLLVKSTPNFPITTLLLAVAESKPKNLELHSDWSTNCATVVGQLSNNSFLFIIIYWCQQWQDSNPKT